MAGGYPSSDEGEDEDTDMQETTEPVTASEVLSDRSSDQAENRPQQNLTSTVKEVVTETEHSNHAKNILEEQAKSMTNSRISFPRGFSEDVDDNDDDDHVLNGGPVKRPTPLILSKHSTTPAQFSPTKKSPRRSDEEDWDSPGPKKPRRSLFGFDETTNEESDPTTPTTPNQDLYVQTPPSPPPVEFSEDIFADETDHRAADELFSGLSLNPEPWDINAGLGTISNSLGLLASDTESSRASTPESHDPTLTGFYELRMNRDRNITGSVLDWDQSGNYDPVEEERRMKEERKKARARAKRLRESRKQREDVAKCIVRLGPFTNFGIVEDIVGEEDNWPEGWSDDEGDEAGKPRRDVIPRPEIPKTTQRPIPDPAGLVDDLTGYPAARGCKHCRRNKLSCTAIIDGTFPCQQCGDVDDDEDEACEPIIPPFPTGPCRHCIEIESLYCSLTDAFAEAHGVCYQCDADGEERCIPGYQRIDLDKMAWSDERKHAACTECRLKKWKCSVSSKKKKPPCRQCKKNDTTCTFHDIPKVDRSKKGKGKKTAANPNNSDATKKPQSIADIFDGLDLSKTLGELFAEAAAPEVEEDIILEDTHGRSGKVTEITTSFAHPIAFNAPTLQCDFCELPQLGFLGLNEVQGVQVLEWKNGLGYTELHGGHHENFPETTMCSACTSTRLQIVLCDAGPGHSVQWIPQEELMPVDAMASILLSAAAGEDTRTQLADWCSTCFRPAVFRCCTPQESVTDTHDKIQGCGLALCETCERTLREEHAGRFQDFVEALALQPKYREGQIEGVVRADVGFLMADGLLVQVAVAQQREAEQREAEQREAEQQQAEWGGEMEVDGGDGFDGQEYFGAARS